MKSSVDLTIVKHPSWDELNTKDFAKDFENEDLTELFKWIGIVRHSTLYLT
mgnify:CR=1 FL=1